MQSFGEKIWDLFFQDFNLLDTLTISENIALALTINHIPVREIEPRVEEIAKSLNIANILDKYPYQVSGGQKQRLSIAKSHCKKSGDLYF
mgnify:CR=1 FL=1